MSYPRQRPPQPRRIQLRGLGFQFYHWDGEEPAILLLHGWGDTGETYQFLADHLPGRRALVAYDARGFGGTEWPREGYWFADYLADLDAVIDLLSPAEPIDLVGHSMGGNVAMLYAGVRPERVRRLLNLEGFGMPRTQPEQAPGRYKQWLDELKAGSRFATYDSFEQFAAILAHRNPRTPPDRLDFIVRSWGRQRSDGRIELRADPRHKFVNPVLYQRDQVLACWRQITAPTLVVVGENSEFAGRVLRQKEMEQWRTSREEIPLATIAGAGHMLHHEQPQALAELMESFFR